MSVPPADLNVLINKLLDETISDHEHAQLRDHLRGNPAAIKEYLFQIGVHTSLRELEEETADEVMTSPRPRLIKHSQPALLRRKVAGQPLWKMFGTPAIVCAIVLWGVSSQWNGEQGRRGGDENRTAGESLEEMASAGASTSTAPAVPVRKRSPVTLTQAAQVELFFERTPEIGAQIELGREFSLSKGQVELTFDCGATAVIQAPAVFVVTGPTRIEMKMGQCSVHAPPSATGFEVITPQGRIVDLGTRFSVVARELGVSDVQVMEGAVEYHATAAETTQKAGTMLLEGEAVRIPDASHESEVIPFNRNAYRNRFPDRIISYTATPHPEGRGVTDLKSVTVQRGGEICVYPVEELIGIELLHFSAATKTNSFCSSDSNPRRADLLLTESVSLTEGITNFDRPGPRQPVTDFREFRKHHGLAVQFKQPVVNKPGPDVVLFELQSAAYPPAGDAIDISPIENGERLKTHHLKQFDITIHSSNALQVAPVMTHLLEKSPTSLEELLNLKVIRSSLLHVPFYALAVGIDFSDLGYQENASVPGLFIEDGDVDDFVAIDIVYIGGLPAESPTSIGNTKAGRP